jgi:murein DD-endopeptidase MepM/ murein hydrolase activator NlpD
MNRIFTLLLLFFLVSCAKVESTPAPLVVSTKALPTNTSLPPTSLPPSTSTQEISCDPSKADYCITDGPLIFQRPIQQPANDLVDSTYTYGSTANGTREPHHGVEFPNATATPIYAAGEGTVRFAGADVAAIYSPWPDFYGKLVVIEHADRLFTLYAHLSKIDVETGQRVFVGEKIGDLRPFDPAAFVEALYSDAGGGEAA